LLLELELFESIFGFTWGRFHSLAVAEGMKDLSTQRKLQCRAPIIGIT